MDIERLKKHFAGKYEFIKLLGKGGFAEVYLALDKMLERKVAIKILLVQHASDPDIVKRFIREARLYAKLEHPNLISIYETGIAEGTVFIVMKYIDGENLKYYIDKDKSTRLDLAPIIIAGLLKVLHYIHEKGIIHKDIKPSNIIVEKESMNIYLADFGLSGLDINESKVKSNFVMGTPNYISPEQIKGGPADKRSDIYSLGATLYELISGGPLFSADSPEEILDMQISDEPENINRKIPEASEQLKFIISCCIEKNPNKRFQNAKEIYEFLTIKRKVSILSYLKSIKLFIKERL